MEMVEKGQGCQLLVVRPKHPMTNPTGMNLDSKVARKVRNSDIPNPAGSEPGAAPGRQDCRVHQ